MSLVDRALPQSASSARLRALDDLLGLATACALVVIIALAFWLRFTGLEGQDGTLSIDEARLALAGRGILEHGVPVMPTGWLYTRGLLPAYLVAASFATLGQTDLAARLPSVLAGTLLVPVMYFTGRLLAGRAGGLFAALAVAAYPPLVTWSREAWFYALYVLLCMAALFFILRAQRSQHPHDRILAGLLAGLTLFAHELGVFLVVPLAAQAALRLWQGRREPKGWRASLTALAIFTAMAALALLLTLGLRAETLGGRLSEIDQYALSPRLDEHTLSFYSDMLFQPYGLLPGIALLAIPLAVVRRAWETLILWLALIPPFLYVSTLEQYDRYGLTFVVVLIALAAQGTAFLAEWCIGRRHVDSASLDSGYATRVSPADPSPAGPRAPGLSSVDPRLSGLSAVGSRVPSPTASELLPGAVTLVILALVLLFRVNLHAAAEAARDYPKAGAWLSMARQLGITRDTLVMTDLPTVVEWYIGGVDYWPRSQKYEKYTFRGSGLPREVHSGAVLIRTLDDYERLVVEAHAGQTLWVLASGRSGQWESWVDASLRSTLERSASQRLAVDSDSYVQFSNDSEMLRIDLK
ncbi:MAG: glycosyltransferase family 39 protein [Chloroflexi bacterium]|nr:glycosyltransferase family 39 protein [Chloroflexota bacterium]